MAINYQAKIDLIVGGLEEIKQAERRIKNLVSESKKLKRGSIAQRGTAALATVTRGERQASRRSVRAAERRLELQSKLNSATDLYNRKLEEFNRVGAKGNSTLVSRAARIKQAFEVATKGGTKNLRLTRALATEMDRVVQKQRESNRLQTLKNKGASEGRRGFERLDELSSAGVTGSRIDRARSLVRSVGSAAASGDQAAYNEALRKAKDAINRLEREYKKGAKAERDLTRSRQQAKQARNKRLNNIGAAAGFPLLFGGGLGSVGGGVLGAAFGGFGGSIVGSALGQQLDKLGAAALNTAKAFDDVASNLDVVLKKLGESNTTIGARATFLADQGFTNQAAAAVQLRAQETLGNKRVQQFKELARSAKEFDNALERLGIGLQSLITPLVKGLADAVTGTQPKAAPTGEQKALGKIFIAKSDIRMLEIAQKLAIERGATLSKQDKERLQALKAQLVVQQEKLLNVEGETEAERILLDLSRKRLAAIKDIGESEVSLAQRQLTERRDVLAADQGALAVQKAQDELTRIRGEMDANLATGGAGVVGRAIKLEEEEAKAFAKLGVARANAANSVLKAEREITRETEAQAIQAVTAFSKRLNIMTQMDILSRGTTHTFDAQFDALVDIQKIETNVLNLKQEQERVGVREGELKKAMLIKQKQERDLLEDKQGYQRMQAIAAQAERLDREQAIKDTRAIRTLEAEINAERQKRATDPALMMSFAGAGLGFFSSSSKLEADQLAERTAKLESFNEQIAKLQQRQIEATERGASADKLFDLGTSLDDLKNLRDTYERLQPGIDEAALAQARFNDAMAISVPITDSLFNNLMSVVEGTKTAEQAFADFLRTIADMLMQAAKQMIAQYIAIGIARMFAIPGTPAPTGKQLAFPGLAGVSVAKNGAYFSNGVAEFAKGGIVNKPTMFAYGDGGAGRFGLMGEAGPEAILPLKRGPGGRLGVESSGEVGNVVVNVDAKGTAVQGDDSRADQLGRLIGAAVQAELIKQKRPGGLLTR